MTDKSKKAEEKWLLVTPDSEVWKKSLRNKPSSPFVFDEGLGPKEAADIIFFVIQSGSWKDQIKSITGKYVDKPIVVIVRPTMVIPDPQFFYELGIHFLLPLTPKQMNSSWPMIEQAAFHSKTIWQNKKDCKAQVRFFSQLIHDLKLPLSSIKYALHGLNEEGEESAELSSIDQAVCFMNQLLNRGLSGFIGIQSQIDREGFTLTETLSQVSQIVQQQMKRQRLGFTFEIGQASDLKLVGDAARIKQIILNLIGNSLKFTPEEGFIKVVCQIEGDANDAVLEVAVMDSGIGIPEEKLPHIFDDFTQAHDRLSVEKGGQGLGLGIVKTLVDELKGSISVTSRLGFGTQFHIVLPIEIKKPTDKTILILEKEPKLVTNMEVLFGDLGYKVLKEKTIGEAKKQIATQSVDFFISDFELGKKSGQNLIHDMKEIKADLPIAVLSGWLNSSDASYYKSHGIKVFSKSDAYEAPLINHVKESLTENPRLRPTLAAKSRRTGEPKILVVDDGEDCRLLLGAYLKSISKHIVFAKNGLEALQSFEKQCFDFVLMDINMPVMDGFAAVQKMRAYEQNRKRKPSSIVALSGINLESDIARCLDLGFNCHLAKPVDRQKLLKTIENYSSVDETSANEEEQKRLSL